MNIWESIENRMMLVVVAIGSFVGLIGAFGHHTHTHNELPSRKWWMARIAITPFLAGAAAMVVEISGIQSDIFAHFVASLLALLGFQSIPLLTRIFEARTGIPMGPAIGEPEAPAEIENEEKQP